MPFSSTGADLRHGEALDLLAALPDASVDLSAPSTVRAHVATPGGFRIEIDAPVEVMAFIFAGAGAVQESIAHGMERALKQQEELDRLNSRIVLL